MMEQNRKIIRLGLVDSTNDYLKKLAAESEELPDGAAVIASGQTGGRGRLGRSFFSPPGCGLYLSVFLSAGRFSSPFFLTASAGIAAAELLRSFGAEVSIKWVNDVLSDRSGKKLCGILAEGITTKDGKLSAVVGVGLNLKKADSVPEDLKSVIGSAEEECGTLPDVSAVPGELLRRFDETLALGENEILFRYRRLCSTIGKKIVWDPLFEGGTTCEGTAEEVLDDGRLLITTDRGEKISVSSGEIKIRKQIS